MKEIIVIEAPTNIGLKEPSPGVEPGVKFLPAALAKTGFYEAIGVKEQLLVEAPAYSMDLDEESGVRNGDAIAGYSQKLAIVIRDVMKRNKIPLVIGGDCSVILGSSIALKQKGNFGMFHLDGHTDYMGPDLSQTKAVAGMGLAIVAGKGHDKLADIDGLKPYIKEENIFCVGNREYDETYVGLSVKSNMRYVDLNGIRSQGIEKLVQDFLQMIKEKQLDGFWIHFDVDALNDEIMPCVDSRAEDGLWYDELKKMLIPLIQSPFFTGMEITILDPTLDKDGRYIHPFVNAMTEILTT